MPDTTLQTSDGPDRLTAAREAGRRDGRAGAPDRAREFPAGDERGAYRLGAVEGARTVAADVVAVQGIECLVCRQVMAADDIEAHMAAGHLGNNVPKVGRQADLDALSRAGQCPQPDDTDLVEDTLTALGNQVTATNLHQVEVSLSFVGSLIDDLPGLTVEECDQVLDRIVDVLDKVIQAKKRRLAG